MLPKQRSFAVALVAIARPTFDVALAQAMTDAALAQLEAAGYQVVGPRNTLLLDGSAATTALAQLAQVQFDLLILFQASFADSSMAVQIAVALQPRGLPLLLWATPDARQGGRLRLNSLCGINLAGHALHLRNIPYDYLCACAGHPSCPAPPRHRPYRRSHRGRAPVPGPPAPGSSPGP